MEQYDNRSFILKKTDIYFFLTKVAMWYKFKGYTRLAERRFNTQIFVFFCFLLGVVGVRIHYALLLNRFSIS